MSGPICVSNPVSSLLPTDIEGLDALAELALGVGVSRFRNASAPGTGCRSLRLPSRCASDHLCIEALRRSSRVAARAATLTADCHAAIEQAAAFARAHFEDPPGIRDWVWGA